MYEYLDRRYALALYEVAEEKGKIKEFIEDLKEIVNLIKTNEELSSMIQHPQISSHKKKVIFKEIFEGKIDSDLLTFLIILITRGRILYLEEKLRQMEKIHLEKNNKIEATVVTALPLNEIQKRALINKLGKKYDKDIILVEEIDKSIIGGVYVRVGDDVIDGTLKTKLEEMRNIMYKEE